MLRIALVDGDLAIRAGRRLMIDSQPNMLLVFEESDAQKALAKIPDLLVDVIVIDHRLKGFDGLELSRRLVEVYSTKGESCPTIIITGTYATPELVLSALRSGASDVVTQDAPMSELLTALNNANESKIMSDFAGFNEILSHAEYVPKPDPLFVLRRSQLSHESKLLLDYLEQGSSFNALEKATGLSAAVLELQLKKLLIDLHFATFEQLQLALHDSNT
ncbi:MAG: response regulator transcription factor [Micrococcales bacterium]